MSDVRGKGGGSRLSADHYRNSSARRVQSRASYAGKNANPAPKSFIAVSVRRECFELQSYLAPCRDQHRSRMEAVRLELERPPAANNVRTCRRQRNPARRAEVSQVEN